MQCTVLNDGLRINKDKSRLGNRQYSSDSIYTSMQYPESENPWGQKANCQGLRGKGIRSDCLMAREFSFGMINFSGTK